MLGMKPELAYKLYHSYCRIRKCLQVLLLTALCLCFSSCSNTFIYNQLDWLIPWYLGDYVDLDRTQRKDFRARLRELQRWHRNEELARYIVLLERIDADLDRTLSGTDVESWANALEAAYDRLEARTLPIAFRLGGQLSNRQMDEFLENLAKEQTELEEKYLQRTDEEYREDTSESFRDAFEDVFGRLNQAQRRAIDDAVGQLERFDAGWLEERAQWLETLSNLLQREPGWEAAVREALANRERDRTESYRQAYGRNAVIVNRLIADVLNLRSEKQDARLRDEIGDYRRDFQKLIAQGSD